MATTIETEVQAGRARTPAARPAHGERGAGAAWLSKAGVAVADSGTAVRVAVIGLFLFASLHAVTIARQVLMPLLFALLLTAVLSSPVARLQRLGAPRALAAALVVAGLLAVLGAGVASLAEPARGWLQRAPYGLEQIEHKLRAVKHSVEEVRETARKVGEVASVGEPPAPEAVARVDLSPRPDPAQRLVSAIPDFTVGAVSMFVLLYFLLAGGVRVFRSLVWCVPAFADKRRAVRIARTAESEFARYLVTVTRTNLVLGGATSLAMLLLGMPNPLLWGVLAGLLNFVPYLGPLTSLAVISLVALASFDTLGQALMPPAAFALLTVIEGQILVPMVIGARFTLHPLLVVLATLVGGWAWGMGGTAIAVPVLMAVKIVSEHLAPMRPLATVLNPDGAREHCAPPPAAVGAAASCCQP